MNARIRFNRLMKYQSIDRLPVIAIEWYYENDALDKWYREGLPLGCEPEDFLGMDRFRVVPVDFSAFPRFKQKVIEDKDDYYIEIEPNMGSTVKRKKDSPTMHYGHIGFPVKDIDDWEKYKKHFNGKSIERVPANMDYLIKRLNNSQDPVNLNFFPFFFRLGFYSMGMEKFMTSFYDNAKLINEMFSYWTDFLLEIIRPYLSKLKIDIVTFNEDLAYKGGPHISPDIYRKFWLPYQNRLISELKRHDIPIICMWTAGDIDILIPILLDNGFNCISTVERCSDNMDPYKLRKKYGKELLMLGGISKKSIIKGPDAINEAIEELIPLISEGGFMPALDDMVPPEIPFSYYKYFVEKIYSIRF